MADERVEAEADLEQISSKGLTDHFFYRFIFL